MAVLNRFLLTLSAFLVLAGCKSTAFYFERFEENAEEHMDKPYVILISIDGYRHDYHKRFGSAELDRVVAEGTYASEGLIPPFPSKTFPSHWSLITGMHPQTHGIVGNTFYDPKWEEKYKYTNKDTAWDGKWYGGWPLWGWAEQNNMRSATMFWPGSEAEIQDQRPSFYFHYKADYPYTQRIDRVLSWLTVEKKYRPHFITLYFDSVDLPSHRNGPLDESVVESVAEMDELLKQLRLGLAKIDLPVNVILVSDHGMEPISKKYIVYLPEIIPGKLRKKIKIMGGKTNLSFFGEPNDLNEAYKILKAKEKHYKVYRRSALPKHLKYNNPRSGELVIVAEAPYVVETRPRAKVKLIKDYLKGYHGYPAKNNKNMHGIFYAWGPNIKRGLDLGTADAVDLYPLMTNILGLPLPAGVDSDPKLADKVYVAPAVP